MGKEIAIKTEHLSKIYRLGEIGTGTISRDMERWFARLRGKEDPFLKIGQTNDRTQKGDSDIVYSLQDINFEIEQGDAVGIIGRNGAGKSTLLKILSRVTSPSTGKINIKGRVASLLEVGTGFHPELTGRENIFLNGAILGMRKKEISRKLDEIIAFSGVERYIDTPVKRYSSGMYVRLAFAVAAHLESEILIVDEVLAVGDAEFQKKCLGKMGEVSKGEGRTVLFVSHNMGAVKDLCNNSILLKTGMVEMIGNTADVIQNYIRTTPTIDSNSLISDRKYRRGNGEARFKSIVVNGNKESINAEEEICIDLEVDILESIDNICFSLMVRGNESRNPITTTPLIPLNKSGLKPGDVLTFSLKIPGNLLRTGIFPLYFWLGKPKYLIGDPYPYDVLDSTHFLNIKSNKTEDQIGYDTENPNGQFNLNYHLSIK